MLDADRAAQIALEYLNQHFPLEDDEIIVFDGMETRDSWVFQYNSRRYLETHDLVYALVEGRPIRVSKHDGTVSL